MRTPLLAAVFVSVFALGACGEGAKVNAPTSDQGSGKGVQEGDKAPAFSLPSVNGQGELAIAPGKVTIVDFWATWCGPCKKSFPEYQDLYVKYKASGLEIVAISLDDQDSGVAEFANEHGAKFPVGWDEGHKVAGKYQPESMPSAYVVGRDGMVKKIHRGFHDGDEAALDKEIKELL